MVGGIKNELYICTCTFFNQLLKTHSPSCFTSYIQKEIKFWEEFKFALSTHQENCLTLAFNLFNLSLVSSRDFISRHVQSSRYPSFTSHFQTQLLGKAVSLLGTSNSPLSMLYISLRYVKPNLYMFSCN